jgi:hypothetical protein
VVETIRTTVAAQQSRIARGACTRASAAGSPPAAAAVAAAAAAAEAEAEAEAAAAAAAAAADAAGEAAAQEVQVHVHGALVTTRFGTAVQWPGQRQCDEPDCGGGCGGCGSCGGAALGYEQSPEQALALLADAL